MVLIEEIIMANCRLCHSKPGLHDINTDKKLVKDINDFLKIKVNGKCKGLLPHSVCGDCRKMVTKFSDYKQFIKKVDQRLHKILKNYQLKSDSNSHLEFNQCPVDSGDALKKHLRSHTANSKFKNIDDKYLISCSNYNLTFQNLKEQETHDCSLLKGAENHQNSDIQNDNSPSNLDNKTEKKSQYICSWENCHKILSSAYSLKTHELKHEGKRSFLCVTCGKGFITKNSLTCHEKTHLEVKGYVCKVCNIGFSVRSNLRAHEKKHHEGVRFYCSQCTKAFASKCSLDRHERIHTGIKDFKCQSCPSAFYTKKELLKHQRYHQGLRLHKCGECFKTFFERHHLIIHMRSHTGEKPYVCTIANCGKSFAESQKLKRHHNAKHAQN